MTYPAAHRSTMRKKIIDSARRLFNRHGFESVSPAEIMAGAGLTHGGFYSYFNSKSDLYAEVLDCFFTNPAWKNCWEGVHSICLQPMWVRGSFVPICHGSTLRMLKTPALWSRCRPTSRVAMRGYDAPSRRYSRRW